MEVGDYVFTRINILDIKEGTKGIVTKLTPFVEVRFIKRVKNRTILRILNVNISDLGKIERSKL